MIRVVIDTNIVVSEMLRSGGLPHAVFNLAVDRVVHLCISEPVMAEYEDVLRRPHLGIHAGKGTTALARIRETGLLMKPTARVTAASDPDDNMFLECAEAAAGRLSDHRQRKGFPQVWVMTRIVTARHFGSILP